MATRTNLAVRPACKNDATNWSGPGGSGRVTGLTGMDRTTGFYTPGPDMATEYSTVTAGLSYVLSVQVHGTGGASVGTYNINWLTAGGGYISSSATTPFTVGAGAVQRLTAIDTAPATAGRALLVVEGLDAGATVTALLIEQAAAFAGYFDGDTAGAAWTGTNGSSTSTLADAGSSAGVPFLQTRLGGGARLAVEAAFGANLTELSEAAALAWTWTDITGDVLQADGAQIEITVGRADEAAQSQPASCRLLLDNRSGDYSLGGQSARWPNVRKGTPIRVRVDPSGSGANYTTRFQGYADGWQPRWDPTGRFAAVALSASGVLRRLSGNDKPVRSAMYGAIGGVDDLIAYWPCEEGDDAQLIASWRSDWSPMTFTGRPGFGESTAFACSQPLPTGKISSWFGAVRGYASSSSVQLRWLMDVPADGQLATVAELNMTGSATRWAVRIEKNGLIRLWAYSSLAQIVDAYTDFFAPNGKRGQWGLSLTQNGANIDWRIDFLEVGNAVGYYFYGTLNNATLGQASQVGMHTDTDSESRIALGHVALYRTLQDMFLNSRQLEAYSGEATTGSGGRLERLAAIGRMSINIVGDLASGLANQTVDAMGPQRPESLVALFREVEVADGGILHDGRSVGLTYVTRRRRMNRAAGLTLNAAAGEVSFDPVHDDQGLRNRVTVTRKGGSDAEYEDEDGPLGTQVVGVYDDSFTVNAVSEGVLDHYARWAVHQGTVEGYRHPRLSINLARDPGLAASWLALQLGERIDITNITSVRSQVPAGTISLGLAGYTETIDQFRWDVEANCYPYEPWRVATIAATSGDTSEYVLRAESDYSSLASSAAQGATSLSVNTPSGPRWTTDADDVPLFIEVGGIRVTVTAISGAGTTQTFTVTGSTVTKALAAGLEVKLWRSPVLAI